MFGLLKVTSAATGMAAGGLQWQGFNPYWTLLAILVLLVPPSSASASINMVNLTNRLLSGEPPYTQPSSTIYTAPYKLYNSCFSAGFYKGTLCYGSLCTYWASMVPTFFH